MADSRKDRIERVFETALQKSPPERADYLDAVGDVEPELRKEVEALLASKDDGSSIDETPTGVSAAGTEAVDRVTAIRADSPAVGPLERIGPYRIVREVGEGGMGVVYEAEQLAPVRRKVALKLIKWGMDTKAVVARFESERQALALMNHPNIAAVHDAGATETGRPYFAMEFVHGLPVTDYCDKHRLTIQDRLELFIQVCDGVQHAHQKGIIHRDIKPSNVLVTVQNDKPVPKIIDFGVAKATSQRLTEHSVFTELGQLIGTPDYMSPEQAEMTNLDIDTRTDVYSLGVLLYELLVGARPFDPKELGAAGLVELQRKLREEDPPRPSTRVSSLGETSSTSASNRRIEVRSLEKELKGDLDWITMKCLEKDRTRRYETPNALALDVRRYLDSEPVRARPPSTLYRMDRFARRHKSAVGFAAAFAVFLLGFAVVTAVQAGRIARERDRATLEAAKAGSINQFLQEVLGSADPWERGDRELTVLEALGESLARIDESFGDQPLVAAAVRRSIGLTYVSLGRGDEAEPLLESALEVRRALLGEAHEDTAESLFDMGVLRRSQGRYAEAETFAREALALRRRILGNDSAAVAESLNLVAHALDLQGKYGEAEDAGEEALALRRELLGLNHRDVASSLHLLGTIAVEKGEYAKAEALHREALAMRREVLGPEHPAVGESLNALAVVHLNQGELARAKPLYEECLELYGRIFGDEHPDVAMVKENLGGIYFREGRYEETIELLREVLAVRRKMLGDNHTAVARTIHNMGAVYAGAKNYTEAERAYAESLVRLRATLGPDHPDVASALRNVGRFHRDRGDLDEAEQTLREVLDIRLDKLGDDHPDTAEAKITLGDVLVRRKRFEEAEPLLLEARATCEKTFGPEHERTREAAKEIEKLYAAWGKEPAREE